MLAHAHGRSAGSGARRIWRRQGESPGTMPTNSGEQPAGPSPSPCMPTVTREELSRRPSRLLSAGRNRTKADVLLFDLGQESVVVKDFGPRGLIVRSTIGRFSVSRECRAYERLTGLPGVPAFRGRLDAHAFACAFARGRPLPEYARRSLPSSFFRDLEGLLERIHERGVALADLHHRNVIVEEKTGSPALIDFSLALVRPSPWNLPGRWLFERARRLDRIAVERMRLRYEMPAASVPNTAGFRL